MFVFVWLVGVIWNICQVIQEKSITCKQRAHVNFIDKQNRETSIQESINLSQPYQAPDGTWLLFGI